MLPLITIISNRIIKARKERLAQMKEELEGRNRDFRATLDLWGISDPGFEAVWDEMGNHGDQMQVNLHMASSGQDGGRGEDD